jgi:hypothetical protein
VVNSILRIHHLGFGYVVLDSIQCYQLSWLLVNKHAEVLRAVLSGWVLEGANGLSVVAAAAAAAAGTSPGCWLWGRPMMRCECMTGVRSAAAAAAAAAAHQEAGEQGPG